MKYDLKSELEKHEFKAVAGELRKWARAKMKKSPRTRRAVNRMIEQSLKGQ